MKNIELILLCVIIVLLIIMILSPLVRKNKKNNIDRLLKILPNESKELKTLQSYKEKAEDYDRLEENLERLRAKNEEYKEKNSTLLEDKKGLETKLTNKDKEVADKLKEIEEQNKAKKEILEKVKKAEILKEYAGKVVDYLDFCGNILNTANEKISKADVEIAKIMSIFLQQALSKIAEMAKWQYICKDINENAIAILNKDLKNCFQSDKETEQFNAFKKLCISKIKSFTNAILILCEAYSKLSKFVENVESVSSFENEFKNKIAEIKNSTKDVGIIEIAEAEIFTNISNNKGIETTYGNISFPYSTVKNLNSGDIAEIIEFGMKTEFEDMTKTKVLIN